MSPFGLETTFKAPEELKRDDPMSAEKICEDLEVLKQAVLEIYPSLESHMTKEAWSAYIDSLKTTITAPMEPNLVFRRLLRHILHRIPDSHIALMPDLIEPNNTLMWFPSVGLTLCQDTVRIALVANEKQQQYLGRIVTHFNGEPVKKYAEKCFNVMNCYDEQVESTILEEMVLMPRLELDKTTKEHVLTLDDSTTVSFPFSENRQYLVNPTLRRISAWNYRNYQRKVDDYYETRELNDSTSYLALRTFEIPDKQVEDIGQYLDTCKNHLIIDVRNNPGGRDKVLAKLLSYLTDRPMDRQKGGYYWVSKKGKYEMLKYSLNYPPDDELYQEYEQREDGCYLKDSISTLAVVMPDTAINYKGKIYVLTNGHSFSAAMLLPAVLVRNRRCVSVGRETGSAYHKMACLHDAKIRLPNTFQVLNIPMVQTVFDTTECARLPKGRGLLPDYPMPLTYFEMTNGADGETDVMLEYALKLIAEGKYLSETDPFEQSDREEKEALPWNWILWSIVGLVAVVTLGGIVAKKRA